MSVADAELEGLPFYSFMRGGGGGGEDGQVGDGEDVDKGLRQVFFSRFMGVGCCVVCALERLCLWVNN